MSLLCSFYALTKLPVADVLTLTNTYPLWILLISWLRNERSASWTDLACILSGVVGVGLIQSPYLSGRGNFASIIALAGTFATLTLLPLEELIQIGATVAVGVLLDTFVVRALLIPAITYRLGDRAWWPSSSSSR